MRDWKDQKTKEKDQRVNTNTTEEQEYKAHVQRQRDGPNPWERVIENCEMNAQHYAGGKDVSRMRQVMISRKADINKQGGLKK